MKSKENKLIEWINKKTKLDLIPADDKYSSFDCYNDNYIVELKIRNKYYKDKLIEGCKLFNNYHKTLNNGKQFLYIVKDDKGVFVWNINKYIKKILMTEPAFLDCPKTTEFKNNSKLIKICYLLPESISSQI